jgi:two-component system cell cycle response regulator
VRILIADDDPVSRRLLEDTLGRLGHEVVAVSDGSEAVARLLSPDGPRLAILDWMMPGADGMAVCRAVRQRPAPYVYVILLTPRRRRREDMVAGLDAEADDFLTKPINAVELRARLRSGERVLALQEGLLQAQEQLRVDATRDHLTGLWNRGTILEHLGRELSRARREARSVAVVIADVDHFKRVNDEHGRAAGDAVLRGAADRIKSVLRDYDFMGRYGGEEVLFVLPGCGAVTARQAAERVRAVVADQPLAIGDERLAVTVSLGIAWTCTAREEATALIQAAGEALSRAKASGRNRVAD